MCHVPIAIVLFKLFGVDLPAADMLGITAYKSYGDIPENMGEWQYKSRMRAFLLAHEDDKLFNASVSQIFVTLIGIFDISSFVDKSNLDEAKEFINTIVNKISIYFSDQPVLLAINLINELIKEHKVSSIRKAIRGLYAVLATLECDKKDYTIFKTVFNVDKDDKPTGLKDLQDRPTQWSTYFARLRTCTKLTHVYFAETHATEGTYSMLFIRIVAHKMCSQLFGDARQESLGKQAGCLSNMPFLMKQNFLLKENQRTKKLTIIFQTKNKRYTN